MANTTASVTLDESSSFTDTQIKKSIDFTNLNDLPDNVRQAVIDGTLSIVKV